MKNSTDSKESIHSWLFSHYGKENFSPGFERVDKVFQCFRAKFKNKLIVTIAGTNGKGEVAHSIQKYLSDAGISSDLWTSPHLVHVNERYIIQNQQVSEEYLLETFKNTHEILKEEQLSYYEFLYYNFCRLSTVSESEVVIFEVGLGGNYDAVNVFDPDLCAIVSISLDHQAILGETCELILKEKFGISRKGIPLYSSIIEDDLRESLRVLCEKKEVPLIDSCDDALFAHQTYSMRNKLLAKSMFESIYLKLRRENYSESFSLNVSIPGRDEVLSHEARTIRLNGAHNPEGIRQYVSKLERESATFDEIYVGFSKRSHEDLELCLDRILQIPAKRVFLSTYNHIKSCHYNDLSNLTLKNVELMDGWQSQFSKSSQRNILVLGSYYFLGEVKKYLRDSHSAIRSRS